MESLVRHEGKWYKIIPKEHESPKITYGVAWLKIKENKGYKEWFESQRKISKILYNE
jgi:hypothetical protein